MLYKRVLLKLSGELCAGEDMPIDVRVVNTLSREIASLILKGIGVAMVMGGGNIMRGRRITTGVEDELAAHRAGMVATVVNGIILERALVRNGVEAQLMGAFPVAGFVDANSPTIAKDHLRQGHAVIYVGGTGTPFVSTDSAVVIRALECGAQAIFKIMTAVDGVYDRDPQRFKKAKKYTALSYDEAITNKLGVMDLDAFIQAREYKLPIHVFKWGKGKLLKVIQGEHLGTLVTQ